MCILGVVPPLGESPDTKNGGLVYAVTEPIQEFMVFAAYQNRMERRRRSVRGIQNYAYHARSFVAWCEQVKLDPLEMTTDDLEDYFAFLGESLSPATQRNHLKSLRSAYGYAHRRGVVSTDPTREVRLPDLPDREPVIVPTHELRAIRAKCRDQADYALFCLLAYAGLRRVEVRRLRWEGVNFKTATLTVMGKGAKLRKVPVHPELAEALMGLRYHLGEHVFAGPRGMLGDSAMDYRVQRLSGEFTAHDYRRTVATSLYLNGVPTDTIDKIMGWAPRAIRSRYYVNVAGSQLQAAILRLYADAPL